MPGEGSPTALLQSLSLQRNSSSKGKEPEEVMGLSKLPYDMLLNIATYLELRDVYSLQLVSSI